MPSSGVVERVVRVAVLERAARNADRARRVEMVSSLGRSWLAERAEQIRVELGSALERAGGIGSIPSLFALMGLSSHEKPYNRVLAWLADPAASHGAGRAVLGALARRLGPSSLVADLGDPECDVEVRGERVWPSDAGSTGMPDLLVLSANAALLVENKLGSGESGDGQYGEYLQALTNLADTRGIERAAWLAAPQARAVPTSHDGEEPWTGALTHVELAALLREAAGRGGVPAWGRVACLLFAAELDGSSRSRNPREEARRVLELTRDRLPTSRDLVEMTRLTHELSAISAPWEDGK